MVYIDTAKQKFWKYQSSRMVDEDKTTLERGTHSHIFQRIKKLYKKYSH